MVNQGTNRYLGVTTVKSTGEAVIMADGQVGLFYKNRTGDAGVIAVDVNSAGIIPNDEWLVIKAGIPGGKGYRGKDKVAASSIPFLKQNIVNVGVSSPKTFTRRDDEIIIGFDGINPGTVPVMYPGEHRKATIILKGAPIEALGYKGGELMEQFTIYAPDCPHDNCQTCDRCTAVDMYPIFQKLQEDIKNRRISQNKTLADLIDVELIAEGCGGFPNPPTEDVEEWVIEVADSGLESDLQAVQATTNGKVSLKSRNQGISVYAATDYPYDKLSTEDLVIKEGDILTNCDTCPAGYTASNKSGFLYTVKYNPTVVTDADIKTLIPVNIEGDRVIKVSSTIEYLQLVLETALDKTDVDSLLGVDGIEDIATQGKVSQLCVSSKKVTYSWKKSGEKCKVTKFTYYIDLKDDCGTPGSRLDELKAAFPEYNVKFDNAITSATCISRYSCEVYSNVVCSSCAGVDDTFKTLAPAGYQGSDWYCENSSNAYSGCKMGLRIRGGWLEMEHPECVMFDVPFYYDPVLVDAAAGHNEHKYIDDPAKNIKEWSVTRVSAAEKPTHQGFSFMKDVAGDALYFLNESPSKDSVQRYMKGEYSLIYPTKFYVDYFVTLTERNRYQSGYQHFKEITYHFIVEHGKHEDVEVFINKIAQLGGLPVVAASSNI